jgi:MFS family permease
MAGPLSGYLSDRHGARLLSSVGIFLFASSFLGFLLLPTDFSYPAFAAFALLNGIGSGMFSAPNTTAVMNAVPANQRGSAAGIQSAFMNSGMVLSIGIFFSLMIVGLTNTLPSALSKGLHAHGVNVAQSHAIASMPAVGSLFSAFLGFNPLKSLLASQAHAHVSTTQWALLTGKKFFPHLITAPFHHGLGIVFGAAIGLSVVGGVFSLLRGQRFVNEQHSLSEHVGELAAVSGAVPGEPALDIEG